MIAFEVFDHGYSGDPMNQYAAVRATSRSGTRQLDVTLLNGKHMVEAMDILIELLDRTTPMQGLSRLRIPQHMLMASTPNQQLPQGYAERLSGYYGVPTELVRFDRDKAIEHLVAEYRGGSWQEFVERLEKKHGIVLAKVKEKS